MSGLLPLRAEGLEVAEFGTQLVVLDLRHHEVHLLDGAAAVVFDACDGTTAVAELQQEFVKVLSVDPGVAAGLIDDALVTLAASYLLSGHDPPTVSGEVFRERRRTRWWRRVRGS